MKQLRRLFFCLIAGFIMLNGLVLNTNAVESEEPNVSSEAAVLMDAGTGQILYQKNMDQKEYPASTTKIMTVLLALENGEFDDVLTMSHDAVFSILRGSSHIALTTDEQITLEQAVYAALLASANDAANGIAEYVSGSMEAFAEKMTERAHELGAINTHFVNAHGLDDENHYTTAHDLALIMQEAIKHEEFLGQHRTEK